MKRVLILLILTPLMFARTVTKTFTTTENPISQNAQWINGGAIGGSWKNIRIAPNYAFGTQTGANSCSGPGDNCDDSSAIIGGPWGINQTITGVVHVINAGANAAFEEAELRIATTITPSSVTGWELNCSVVIGNPYMQLVRWNGALGDFSPLTASGVGCADGDVMKIVRTGTGTSSNLTAYKALAASPTTFVQQFSWTDTGCSAAWCLLPGSPGLGFFIQTVTGTAAAANAEFGMSSLTATDGVSSLLSDGIIDAQRVTDWTTAGSPAVEASTAWTQCGSTIAAGSSITTINNAIAACTANHFVQLGTGTFNLTSGINFVQKNNVKVVGMGADKTFLIFSGTNGCQGFSAVVCMASSDLNYVLSQSNTANWTAGYALGATSITVSSKTNLSPNSTIVLDQTDDTTDNGNIFVCSANGTIICSTNGDNGGFARTNRGQQQLVTVVSISSGACPCTVVITPGLYMSNWSSGKSPQAWWANNPVSNMGLENLSIDATAAEPSVGVGFGVQMFNCSGCWVKGIRSIQPGRSHVQAQVTTACSVLDSYFFKTAGQTSTSYGIESAGASGCLFQNNIYQQVTEPMSLNGSCSGCVLAYNYDTNERFDSTGGGVFSWRMASVLPHAVGNSHILIEGNQGSGLQGDIIHGSHHFITAYRNAWNGYQKNNGVNPSQNTNPIILNALNRFYNVVGNVLGSPSLPHTNYQTGNAASIYQVGTSESGSATVPADSNVGRTLLRWGNYDTVTGTNRFCGASYSTGFSSTCGSTSEVPASITGGFPNAVPIFGDINIGQVAMPASLYLASKPAWWPSAKAWPPIGPDVSGGNLSGYAGHAFTVPAADCYSSIMLGPADGTGSVLTFNADSCYGAAPAPPQILTVPTAGGVFSKLQPNNPFERVK